MPYRSSSTDTSIVEIVQILKTPATATIAHGVCTAAGYISSGINGSQGPNTNMMNSTHGVIDALVSWP